MRCMAAFLFIALAVCGSVRAGEHPWNNKRIYYIIENAGHLVEKGYFVRRSGSYQKAPCLIIDEEKSFYAPASATPSAPIRSIRIRTLTTLEGFALQRTETSLMENDDSRETITVVGGEAVFDTRGAYGRPGVVPVPGDVLFEIGGEWLRSRAPLPGTEEMSTANVLDRVTRGVVATQVYALDAGVPASASGGANTVTALRAEIATPGLPPVLARYTQDGRLLRLEGSGMVYQVVERDAYEAGKIPPQLAAPSLANPPALAGDSGLSGSDPFGSLASGDDAAPAAPVSLQNAGPVIPVGASVPAWDSFEWLLLSAEPGYEWLGAVAESEYVEVRAAGTALAVTALQNAPYIDSSVMFPMEAPVDLRALLAATDDIPSGHQAVIDAAYVAVMDAESKREERNVLKAVSFLAGWINQYVAVEPWGGYQSSALDALARRAGDSLGHARLFSAMARTLGVPTRLCQGFLATKGRAVNHCWSEAWINGKWIPVDTTVSRVGLPAGYILAERDDGRGVFRFDVAGFMRTAGLRLTLLSAGRETPGGALAELVSGNRRTYAVAEGDWMANLYWGFSLRLPAGWTGQARLNSVEITSPDGRASVRCEALEGDFKAGEDELESTVRSLDENLDQFDEIESRVVSFDGDGATPALYVDFACERDGDALRCRQYIVPRRERALRISFWAPEERFTEYTSAFDQIVASFEF